MYCINLILLEAVIIKTFQKKNFKMQFEKSFRFFLLTQTEMILALYINYVIVFIFQKLRFR